MMAQWIEQLGRVDLFSAAPPKERDALLERAREIRLARRQPLVPASPAPLYVALRGELKLVRGGNDGPRLLYDFIRPGEVWGEEAVIFSGRHDLTAVALSPALVLALPAEGVRDLVNEHPRLARAFAALCASRSRALQERLFHHATGPVNARVAWSLHQLAGRFGRRDRQGTVLEIRLTHQDLADFVGASRETVTLVLTRLKKNGVLLTHGRRLVITDLNRLKKLSAH